MSNEITNSFRKGMRLGVADTVSDNDEARELRNFRLVQGEGESFILHTVRGTEQRSSLPAGFAVVGHCVHAGVCYLMLHNAVTGEGEVGSFPSPLNGQLTDRYQALQNFLQPDGTYGRFRTPLFKFQPEGHVQLLAQPDYDGSVNLIFNSAGVPPRLLNTGFRVGPGTSAALVVRQGERDTNRYSAANFEDTLQLIQRSKRILRVDFLGVVEGGRQKAGNYHYYFRYGTSDGNVTDVIGESLTVMVAHGDRIANTRGGDGQGEDTSKCTHFRLAHLDNSYKHMHVFFVHSTGDTDIVRSAYRLSQPLPVKGSEMSFIHTGYEEVERIDINELSVDMPGIEQVGTIEQAQGHLFLGDISERDQQSTLLREVAASMALGYESVNLPTPGFATLDPLYTEPHQQPEIPARPGGWNNGYANPMNTYHRLGYFGGEAYAYAVKYIFPDGSLSAAFPLVGYDQKDNDMNPLAVLGKLFTSQGLVSGTTRMENNRGIFRFPNRNATGMKPLVRMSVDPNNSLTVGLDVLGVTIYIGAIPPDLYARVKKETLGVQFFRAARKPDLLAQGSLLPTYSVPSIDTPTIKNSVEDAVACGWFKKYTASDLFNRSFSPQFWTGNNRRVVPLLAGVLEGPIWKPDVDSSDVWRVAPFRLWEEYADPERYALYSLDVQLDPVRYGASFNDRPVGVSFVGRLALRGQFAHVHDANVISQTLYIPAGYTVLSPTAVRSGKSYYSPDGSDDSMDANNYFARYIHHLGLYDRADGSDGAFTKVERLHFGDYLGLHLPGSARDAVLVPTTKSKPDDTGGTWGYHTLTDGDTLNKDTSEPVTYLVNLYGPTGQRTSSATWDVNRNIDANRYFPISGRMYWDNTILGADPANTVAGKLDTAGRLLLFGGDCFVGYGYKRTYYGDPRYDQVDANRQRLGGVLGRGMALVQESAFNMYMRTEEKASGSETESRSFFPYYRHDSPERNIFFRQQKVREAQEKNNRGYGKTDSDRIALTLPQDVPYIRSRWFSRVVASGKHTPNSFENGYRYFAGLAQQDYDSQYGALVLLKAMNGQLVAFFEHAIAVLPVNERVQTGSDAAGAIFVESAGLLPPSMGLLTEAFGCKDARQVVRTDNYLYLANPEKALIARLQPQGTGAEILSDVAVSPYLKQHGRTARVIAFTDPENEEVLFTYLDAAHPGGGFTLSYSELLGFWNGFYDFVPHVGFALSDDRLFTIPRAGEGIWEHHAGAFLQFYDQQVPAVLRFVTNPMAGFHVAYTTQALRSSNLLPAQAGYRVRGAKAALDVVYDERDPVQTTARRLRGETWLTLPLVDALTEEGTGAWLDAGEDTAAAEFEVGSRLRGEALETRLAFESTRQVRIDSITTYIQ